MLSIFCFYAIGIMNFYVSIYFLYGKLFILFGIIRKLLLFH